MRRKDWWMVFAFALALAVGFQTGCGSEPPVAAPTYEVPIEQRCPAVEGEGCYQLVDGWWQYVPPVEPEPTCVIPDAEDPNWGRAWEAMATKGPEHTRAKDTMGERCGEHPEATLITLANTLVEQGECAAFRTDAVFIDLGGGFYEEWHSAAYTTGCWMRQNPELLPNGEAHPNRGRPAYKATWRYE